MVLDFLLPVMKDKVILFFRMQEDDVVSRVHDLDFSSLRSQLGPLATVSA